MTRSRPTDPTSKQIPADRRTKRSAYLDLAELRETLSKEDYTWHRFSNRGVLVVSLAKLDLFRRIAKKGFFWNSRPETNDPKYAFGYARQKPRNTRRRIIILFSTLQVSRRPGCRIPNPRRSTRGIVLFQRSQQPLGIKRNATIYLSLYQRVQTNASFRNSLPVHGLDRPPSTRSPTGRIYIRSLRERLRVNLRDPSCSAHRIVFSL